MRPGDRVSAMGQKKNLLTIITPVFNGQDYIAETIESVLNLSTEFAFDYVVIDDGSTDATAKIIEKYSERLRNFRQENKGEAASVNFGITQAIGAYCIIVNHDDPVFTSELFSESIKLLESHDGLVATYPDWFVIDENGKRLELRETSEYSITELVGFSNCIPGPGTCFRKAAALSAGGRNAKYKFVSDYDLWLRLSNFGEFRRIPKPLAQWRLHSDSTSVKMNSVDMAQERIEVIKEYLSSADATVRFSRIALSHAYYFAARLSLSSNEIPGRKFLLESIRIRKKMPEKARFLVVLTILFAPLSLNFYRRIERYLPTRYRIKT